MWFIGLNNFILDIIIIEYFNDFHDVERFNKIVLDKKDNGGKADGGKKKKGGFC